MSITFYHNMLSSYGGDDNNLPSPVERLQGGRQQIQSKATGADMQDKPAEYSRAVWPPSELL